MKRSAIYILICLCFPFSAMAVRLVVDESSPMIWHIGAAILLYLHIISGAIGLLSGTIAIFSRKGGQLHRKTGKVFLYAMFICFLIGAVVSPFLPEGQRPNFVAAVLSLYLLITSVIAARRKPFASQYSEKAGLAIALLITALGFTFFYMGQNSETGTVDGAPPQAFIIFIVFGSLAAVGDLRVLIKTKLSATARIIRHLWRMCASFFIASTSLFLGQPQFFPDWFNDSYLPLVLSLFPLLVLIFYVIKIKYQFYRTKRSKSVMS